MVESYIFVSIAERCLLMVLDVYLYSSGCRGYRWRRQSGSNSGTAWSAVTLRSGPCWRTFIPGPQLLTSRSHLATFLICTSAYPRNPFGCTRRALVFEATYSSLITGSIRAQYPDLSPHAREWPVITVSARCQDQTLETLEPRAPS